MTSVGRPQYAAHSASTQTLAEIFGPRVNGLGSHRGVKFAIRMIPSHLATLTARPPSNAYPPYCIMVRVGNRLCEGGGTVFMLGGRAYSSYEPPRQAANAVHPKP